MLPLSTRRNFLVATESPLDGPDPWTQPFRSLEFRSAHLSPPATGRFLQEMSSKGSPVGLESLLCAFKHLCPHPSKQVTPQPGLPRSPWGHPLSVCPSLDGEHRVPRLVCHGHFWTPGVQHSAGMWACQGEARCWPCWKLEQ